MAAKKQGAKVSLTIKELHRISEALGICVADTERFNDDSLRESSKRQSANHRAYYRLMEKIDDVIRRLRNA